ncbi:MAG: response regulator, partial [Saprospiraceae bacterium]|nr:response regulator [Saprospiraceae bacterium]
GILGFTNLLKERGLSGETQQEYISIIEKSGDRMLNTIKNIMDISMIESNQVKTSISPVDINEQTNTLFSFFKPEVEKKGMSYKLINTLNNEEATIKTDKEKVYAILTNLIKNSIKYSKKGSIEFGYNLIPDKQFPVVKFYIKDTGIGIPKDRQKAIFDRFVQADIEDKEVYEGSGLGLSISKAYVEMMGGKIWVESEVGVGSTFYFTLPYHSIKKEKIETDPDSNREENLQDTQDKKLKILIAEDEEYADRHLSILLKNIGKEFLHAKTGIEAVDLFKQHPDIDLILMDVKMPLMNGHEATKQIRKLNREVIIIAQTAYALEGDKEKAIEAGCDDYISKPIDKEVLLEKIGRLVSC